ncbi:MAG: carbon-nitrogen hydrolase family protein, partial [Defluviitaleaceae bacterium]|nr:carbon-nitrogen hydrolase family protein [Defluviitaleaceae bacterium]
MRKLHAASAQVNSIAMDPKGNLEKIRKQALCASIVGADAIVFAETAIHAYCLFPENLAQAEPVGGPLTGQILEWAKEYSIIIMAGFLEKSELGIHNSHVIARPDGSMFSVRKNGLTPTELNAGLIAG